MAPFGLMSAGASILNKSFSLFSNVSSLARFVRVIPAGKSFTTSAGPPPKRPLTGYMRFVKQQQPVVVRQYPDVKAVDVIRKIAQQWRTLTADQKQPFEQASVVDREQFKVDLQRYQSQLSPAQAAVLKEDRRRRLAKRKAIRKKRELNSLGKPKRPRSAFNIYMAEHFEESRGTTMQGKMKMLREDWTKLATSQKQVYMQLAEDDKVRYKNEMKSWEEHMMDIGREDLIRRKEKKKMSTKGGKKKSKVKVLKTKAAGAMMV